MKKLSAYEEQFLHGMILGGAQLYRPNFCKHHHLRMNDRDVFWLRYKMANLAFLFRGSELKQEGKTCRVWSCSHPILSVMHNRFYGRKCRTASTEVLDVLTDVGLSVWAVDSGVCYGRNGTSFYLSVGKFDTESQDNIWMYFNDVLDMPCTLHGNRLKFSRLGWRELVRVIEPKLPLFALRKLHLSSDGSAR